MVLSKNEIYSVSPQNNGMCFFLTNPDGTGVLESIVYDRIGAQRLLKNCLVLASSFHFREWNNGTYRKTRWKPLTKQKKTLILSIHT